MFRSSLRYINTLRATLSLTHSIRFATVVNPIQVRYKHTPIDPLQPFDARRVPKYTSNPSSAMKSYTQYFPSESDALVKLEFDGETRIWVLTMLGRETPDNRVTHRLIGEALLPALSHVEDAWNDMLSSGASEQGASLVSTGGVDASAKIYSNGLDFEKATADPHFFDTHLNALYEKLLTFPIPTIAAINGHAFAAGFGLACAHDYRVMNAKRGYLCMNEIDFGAPLPYGLQQALASKISNQRTMRKIVLEGHRFSAKEAFDEGFVEGLGESPMDTLDKALELAGKIKVKARMNAWGSNKQVIYARAIQVMRTSNDDSNLALFTPRAKY
ncbi:uncharacterized protein SPSC_04257 [Sporisorium scitamineum]|uniref:Enoyl-CoA hydratase n=1 Tax=Sporisorium scitamineum TaxID=49012 RepID=A0A0F7RZ97_9BASI|nr:uncharacterized protein SPSC_04257 [Sporisorium scitamineum]CDS00384.1 hypothetical protein [Sporisorium scitamineum]